MRVKELRARLARKFPEALPRPTGPERAFPFGIPEIDALLPWGGLPRGRLSEVVGEPGSGRTSLVRSLVRTTREQVALVDTEATLCPSDWIRQDLLVVRGDDLYSADVLLRSRAFGLVVVFGGARGTKRRSSSPLVRLQRLAETAGSACVFVAPMEQGSSVVTTRLEIRGGAFFTRGFPPVVAGRRVVVHLEKGGPPRFTEVVLHEEETDRLLSHPEAPDRAPVAWRGEGGRPSSPRFARGLGNDCSR